MCLSLVNYLMTPPHLRVKANWQSNLQVEPNWSGSLICSSKLTGSLFCGLKLTSSLIWGANRFATASGSGKNLGSAGVKNRLAAIEEKMWSSGWVGVVSKLLDVKSLGTGWGGRKSVGFKTRFTRKSARWRSSKKLPKWWIRCSQNPNNTEVFTAVMQDWLKVKNLLSQQTAEIECTCSLAKIFNESFRDFLMWTISFFVQTPSRKQQKENSPAAARGKSSAEAGFGNL